MGLKSSAAFVSGRIGLVRSLGRAGIPVTLAVPAQDPRVPVRYSRYVRDVVAVPNFGSRPAEAVAFLERYGNTLTNPSVVFCNGESDVLLFARNRNRLSKSFRIPLAPTELLESLVDKGKFAELSALHNLATPATCIPLSKSECIAAARTIGFPCILKPINQRHWHDPAIVQAIGYRKAYLLEFEEQLVRLLDRFPEMNGREMVQEYIPGRDSDHYDVHCYIDRHGRVTGALVAHKLRTYPIHFGMGCYTELVQEPAMLDMCLDTLARIGYTGKANINLKRHAVTGKDYILEINPRFSVWTAFDQACGVNFAEMQYHDALCMDVRLQQPRVTSQRFLWFGHDILAMHQYRTAGEMTFLQWLRSLFTVPGKIEWHVFAWDDPLVMPATWIYGLKNILRRATNGVSRRLGIRKRVLPVSSV